MRPVENAAKSTPPTSFLIAVFVNETIFFFFFFVTNLSFHCLKWGFNSFSDRALVNDF